MRKLLPIVALLAPALWTTASPGFKTVPAWSMFGGSPSRNMVCPEAHDLPDDWNVKKKVNIKWIATLGSRAYSQPVVIGDRVLVGTNDENPRNKRDRGKPTEDNPEGPPLDKGVMMCFRASDGRFLWQAVHDMLESGLVNDWPHVGICSTPAVEAERAYYVSNRCEVVCVSLKGLTGGNEGFQHEQYRDVSDADIVWSFDMMKELKVFPHNKAACSPLIVGELIFVITGNGVDESHIIVPEPDAPSFICLDKKTGKLVWQSNLPGRAIMHSQWSSPAYIEIKGKGQVLFPGGDGWLYALEPKTGKLIWKFDANPKYSVYELGGKGTRSDFIGLPVAYDNRVFIATGQDPEHFDGVGHLWCIDPAGKTGDISPDLVTDASMAPPLTKKNPNSGVVWHYGGDDNRQNSRRDIVFGRSLSTPCIVDNVLYMPDIAGYIHCLGARTGKRYWMLDTRASIWGSAFYADGKVYVANEDGDVYVIRHDPKPKVMEDPQDSYDRARSAFLQNRDPKATNGNMLKQASAAGAAAYRQAMNRARDKVVIRKIEMEEAFRGTPSAVGDTLYIASERRLYAISKKKVGD